MKDWKGNKIQVGHTVVVVSTGSMFEGLTPCFSVMTENGRKAFNGKPAKKSHRFDVSAKFLITEPSNDLKISMDDNPSEIPINLINHWVIKQPWQIICIEGISDSKDEYLQSLR